MRARALGLVLLVFLGCYASYASLVMLRFPNSGDEYSYLFQAKLFASGALSMPSPPESVRAAFELDHVVDDGERRRGKFTPGWSVLLVPGVLVGAAWLMNPLVSVISLGLLWLTLCRIATQRAAWAALVVVGVSPLFAINAASFFSHNASFLCGSLALYALVRCADSERPWWALVCGAAMGFGLTVRPLDGAMYGLAALVCTPMLGWRHFLAMGAGAAPSVLGYLLYNQLQFGAPWITGYAAYHETIMRLYAGEQIPLGLGNITHVSEHLGWLNSFFLWSVPAAFAFVPLAFGSNRGGTALRSALRFSAMLAILEIAMLNLVTPNQGDHYGPRYILPLLLPLGVLSGLGFERVSGAFFGESRVPLVASLLLVLIPAIGFSLREAGPIHVTTDSRSRLFRMVQEAGLDGVGVIVRFTHDRRDHWFTRNGIDYEGSVLFVRDLGLEHQLRQVFPDRDIYEYRFDRTEWRPVLELLPAEQRVAPVAPRAATGGT